MEVVIVVIILVLLVGLIGWSVTRSYEESDRVRTGFHLLSEKVDRTISTNYDIKDSLEKNFDKILNSRQESDKEKQRLIETLEKNFDIMKENQILKMKQREYKQFFGLFLETLSEDTEFIKSDFFQRFGSVPEYSALNSQIIAFQNKIDQIKITLKEYKMMEDYEE